MNSYLAKLKEVPGASVALICGQSQLTYTELLSKVNQFSNWLLDKRVRSLALLAQNSIEWVIVDLACQQAGILLTPVPLFFSEDQVNRVLASVKPDLILSDTKLGFTLTCISSDLNLNVYQLPQRVFADVPSQTAKVTYTSGSSGAPKGVCLSLNNQWCVASSLVDVINISCPKHLCLLPLPTLLENIAGVYSPLLAGGTVILPSDDERGFSGSSLTQPHKLLACITRYQPTTLICVPELLQVLVSACSKGWSPPQSLTFIAVGGSKVSPRLLQKAKAFGLPVYQGYGLSECASVVSLCNSLDDNRSCGAVLPHLSLEVINEEIIVNGNAFLGYLEDRASWGIQRIETGDLGSLENGKLQIHGRRKNTIITSYGRNVSPEWVEAELLATGAFIQAVVLGDAKPFCTAILVPANPTASEKQLSAIVESVNITLPDYARVQRPIILCSLMTPQQGLYTDNMRPKRTQIHHHFLKKIEEVYSL
ncbi:AMP-dependent synthetase [Alteromonas sediminis]|uniref:AMP-dependent synthetase n=1 Tax=Alteromonas sediminis TaxID=2259342 RepID=A0A3N5ZAQ6_9ALTE|nr:AMP-binding protein [Alteromonas sediminis]RPJ66618.1 AMP-dependent synthetase [Alteromonas sediminis]